MKERLVPIAAAGVLAVGGVGIIAQRLGLSVDSSGFRQASFFKVCDGGSTATDIKTLVELPFQTWEKRKIGAGDCNINEILFPPQEIDVDFVSQVDNMSRVWAVGKNFSRLAIKFEKGSDNGRMDKELSSSEEAVSNVLVGLNMTGVSLNGTLGEDKLAAVFFLKKGIYPGRGFIEINRGRKTFIVVIVAAGMNSTLVSTEEYFAVGDDKIALVFPVTLDELIGTDFLIFFNQGVLGDNQDRAKIIPLRFRVSK